MKLGFTGTQVGLTILQKEHLIYMLNDLKPDEVHHGDCIGADAEFHDIVREVLPSAKIIIHPPIKNVKRAFKRGDSILPQKDYLDRNKDIVDSSDFLIACPKEITEQLRSGTWSTYRYAKKKNKSNILLLPK